ncbi:MAG: hypothetical protein ACRD2G_01060 [Terriglobia bacterium]
MRRKKQNFRRGAVAKMQEELERTHYNMCAKYGNEATLTDFVRDIRLEKMPAEFTPEELGDAITGAITGEGGTRRCMS